MGVEFVLVRPKRAANVAAASRALKNMGWRRLRLVAPVPALDDPAIRALAYGAWDVLDGAVVCGTLQEAVAGADWVVGTSARPQAGAWTPRRLARRAVADRRSPLSLVFGPEDSGLSRAELALCHGIVRIPAARTHASLNLAQAVLILAYELRLARPRPRRATSGGAPAAGATAGELEAALEQLRGALLDVGYLNPKRPDAVMTELRRWLARSRPNVREVTLLRGLARQVAWAADVARARRGDR